MGAVGVRGGRVGWAGGGRRGGSFTECLTYSGLYFMLGNHQVNGFSQFSNSKVPDVFY